MIDSAIGVFDFAALDDLAFAAERGRLNEDAIPALNAQEIGPVLELIRLSSQSRLLPTPQTASWLVLDGLTPMMQALDNGKELWVCPRTHLVGFLRTSMSSLKDETIWTRFGLSAQQAATRARFPKRIAAQLIAAIGELHSNIYEHSEATGTGLVAYRACPGQFELAVSDSGVGVLESLRTGPDYAALQDHGEALRLTLTSGISRFGSKSHRGHGFRPLFVGLANLNGALRFRSGDHALLIEGRNPSLTTARPAQKPDLQGFCVSVSCVTV